jgi:hypothetical protein
MCKIMPVYHLCIAVSNLYAPSIYFIERRKKKEGRKDGKK